MKILITGASGLVGKALVKKLEKSGHTIHQLVRTKNKLPLQFFWDYKNNEIEKEALKDIHAIIHLAGASIAKRWTSAYQKEIISSRVDSAVFLLNTCKAKNIRLKSFVSASGTNFYGTFTSEKILKESDGILHNDFLSSVCEKWENAAQSFQEIADRVVLLRMAPVLAKNGGSMVTLSKITDLHLASGAGSGKQWFNWIHIDDLVEAYVKVVEDTRYIGPYNVVADEIPTQKEFMKKWAKVRNKLFIPINVPAFMMRLILGKMSEIILEGTRASNHKLKENDFILKYPNLDLAFKDLNSK